MNPGDLAAELVDRIRRLEWLLFDVDGVLTDGRLHYTADGETTKLFHVRDGLGWDFARRVGLKLGILSGRAARALHRRAEERRFDVVLTGHQNKVAAFETFLEQHETRAERVLFIGDDLQDLGVLRRCGVSSAPADARPEVRDAVDLVVDRRGGDEVARELIELLLRVRGQWDDATAPYFEG